MYGLEKPLSGASYRKEITSGLSGTYSGETRVVGRISGTTRQTRDFRGSTTAVSRLVFGIFAALARFEDELIRARTMAGFKAARAPLPAPRCVFEARSAVDKAWRVPAAPVVEFRSLPQTTPSRRATTHERLYPLERCTIELVHPDYQPSKAGFRPVSVRPAPTALNAHADDNRFHRRIAASIPRGTRGRSSLVVCHGQRPSSRGRRISSQRRQPPYAAMCPRDA